MTSEAAEQAEPLVSIVTPCRNAARILNRCLKSVATQDYPHLEHVVVDGSSTDGTLELLQRATGVRWVSERDSGQSEALEKGFRLAQGDILSWLNADDELLPGAVQRVVDSFSARPQAGWIYGRAMINGPGARSSVEPVAPVHDRDLQFGNPIVQPSTFFRRDCLDRVGGVDPSLQLAMDLDLWVRFVNQGIPRAFVPQVLAQMTYAEDSKTALIERAEFMKENFLVYLKNGWMSAAYLALGAIAAYRAMSESRVRKDDLQGEEGWVTEWASQFFDPVDRRCVHAAAAVEACFAEQHVANRLRLTPLRHLADAAPWAWDAGRKRMRHGVGTKLLHRMQARHRLFPQQG